MKGMTLVELLVALLLGLVLMVGTLKLYSHGALTYRFSEDTARLQERGRYVLSTLEPDIELAGFHGLTNAALTGELPAAIDLCGLGRTRPVGSCTPIASSGDTLALRRVETSSVAAEPGRLQVYSARLTGRGAPLLFSDGEVPGPVDADHTVHNLVVRAYYVAPSPAAPALRVKSLTSVSGSPAFIDTEVMPGVEDLQVQFGIAADGVTQYVNPGFAGLDSAHVVAVRVWVRIRADERSQALSDTNTYQYADVTYQPAGDERHFRRAVVSRTIALRNARTS